MSRTLDNPQTVLHTGQAFTLEETVEFAEWLTGLRDRKAKALIVDRINRAADGNFGITRSVQAGVFEMKINHGPGYRVYYFRRGKELIILLCGGDKRTQRADIAYAKQLKEEMERHGGDKTI